MLRALAALPVDLPAAEAATPFQPVAVEDIAATIAWLAGREINDKAPKAVVWDLMQPQTVTLGGVIDQFRLAFGTADHAADGRPPSCSISAPGSAISPSRLGWMPPMRTTAIAELRRGVTGDPKPWMAAPASCPRPSRK